MVWEENLEQAGIYSDKETLNAEILCEGTDWILTDCQTVWLIEREGEGAVEGHIITSYLQIYIYI